MILKTKSLFGLGKKGNSRIELSKNKLILK